MPLFDLTERLFAELKFSEIKDMIKQSAYICAFYDSLSKYLTDNSSDIAGFLKEWDSHIHEKSIHSDGDGGIRFLTICLLYTSPSPRDRQKSRMPSSA